MNNEIINVLINVFEDAEGDFPAAVDALCDGEYIGSLELTQEQVEEVNEYIQHLYWIIGLLKFMREPRSSGDLRTNAVVDSVETIKEIEDMGFCIERGNRNFTVAGKEFNLETYKWDQSKSSLTEIGQIVKELLEDTIPQYI